MTYKNGLLPRVEKEIEFNPVTDFVDLELTLTKIMMENPILSAVIEETSERVGDDQEYSLFLAAKVYQSMEDEGKLPKVSGAVLDVYRSNSIKGQHRSDVWKVLNSVKNYNPKIHDILVDELDCGSISSSYVFPTVVMYHLLQNQAEANKMEEEFKLDF